MKAFYQLLFLFLSTFITAQTPTSANLVQQALKDKAELTKTSIVKDIAFTSIGPTVMSGRVADIAVNPNNPTEFYVGYASGGLWHTTNNGSTFTPILDSSPTQNIGDIAVDWTTKTIWVGTGEKNSSRSSYAGIGILKSTDNGNTWLNVGLTDAHHVSRILINPNNPNHVVIGVIGHLYSPNAERGVFKTTDGGKTWSKTLFISNDTGIIDIAAAPENFNIMYAASWQRNRKAWHFDGDGAASAIYKSTDAGLTWSKISDKSGFPTGNGVGRIGLAVYNADTVYALHDSQYRRQPKTKTVAATTLSKQEFEKLTTAQVLALRNKTLDGYLKASGFQEKFRAENVKQLLRPGGMQPKELVAFLEDETAVAFEEPVIGAEVFKTTNGGKNWAKTHSNCLDGIYSSYGYYFGEIRVDPKDKNGIYVLGVNMIKSKDGGKNFTSISKENVHSDHQALWVNPNKKGHIINGNDGGLNMSYDDGESWFKLNTPAVGQFYAIYADHQKPYKVYGGLQDNGVWVGAHNAKINKAWHQSGQNPYQSIMGGDGMQVQVDKRDANIVYTGYQFGNYYRINRTTGKRVYIQPRADKKEKPFRFNWQTPIHLSKHNQDILYLGSNKLHRSLDQGTTWATISNDLTTGGKKGNVAYGTLTTLSESPFEFGLIYVGSDDGYINLTKNGGGSWSRISNTLPQNLWVSRVIASKHKKERVYATLNGYRFDDFSTYIYKSDDYGKTWQNISSNMPTAPVNVIKEDPENSNVLYVGTDNGVYTTFNAGTTWHPFSKNIPNVAVHDLVIQPEAKHLIIGTHGRSLYKADISAIQATTADILDKDLHIFDMKAIKKSKNWGRSWSQWRTPNTPKLNIPFYSKTNGTLSVHIYKDKLLVNTFKTEAIKGFNTATYDLSFSKKGLKSYNKAQRKNKTKTKLKTAENGVTYLPKGSYTVKINAVSSAFEVE